MQDLHLYINVLKYCSCLLENIRLLTSAERERYTNKYRVVNWFDHSFADFVCDEVGLDGEPIVRHEAIYRSAGSLSLLETIGRMPKKIETIFDFGTGFGEGLAALDMFLRDRSKVSITGSELIPRRRAVAQEVQKLLTIQDVEIVEDGLEYLEKAPSGSIDLITVNLLGPIANGFKTINSLVTAGLPALTEWGVMSINADDTTMDRVHSYAHTNELNYIAVRADEDGRMPENLAPGFSNIPHVFIFR